MKLTLTKRPKSTKGALNQMRREGNIPAVFYGSQDGAAETVAVQGAEFQAALRKMRQGLLATQVFELDFDGKKSKAIIKDVQYNHATYAIEHIDFLELEDGRPVTVNVPIQILGGAECPGVKLGGTLRQVIRSLKVACLPKHIPQEFSLDVRDLNLAQAKRLSDLTIPEHVQPKATMSEVAVVIAKGKTTA